MVATRLLTTGAIVAGSLLPSPASASTYLVTSAANAGPGTLRQAILDSNAHPGADAVRFNLPGPGVHTIAITSGQLPAVNETLVINGRSQPGFAGTPLVRVDNASGKQLTGLNIAAAQSEVLGLGLTRFAIGVRVAGNANRVQGNLIGTNAAGAAGLGNATGVKVVSGAENRIGGIASSAPNVVSGNTNIGIEMVGAATTDTMVAGNRIGTNPAGTAARPNGGGVRISDGSTGNVIGGTTTAERNLISGNSTGVFLNATNFNTISGNYIGTDATGSAPLGNAFAGVSIFRGDSNVIGGTTAGARNVISANGSGVHMNSGSNNAVAFNRVAGNYIGTDATGSAALGNGVGVTVLAHDFGSACCNLIGGSTAGARNVISGNTGYGVVFDGANINGGDFFSNDVSGNYIGTTAGGGAALPNGGGVHFLEGVEMNGNTIGGTVPGERNVISGNAGWGVVLSGNTTHGNDAFGNTVAGNYIGTKSGGGHALGNGDGGVRLETGAQEDVVEANRIAFNGGPGVAVDGTPDPNGAVASANRILGNSIFTNGGLGIDLVNGGNHDQAAPTITSVTTNGGSTTIEGTLASTPSTTFRIELFSSPRCDPSGAGEGKTFLGFTNATTDGAGNASFSSTVAAVPAAQAVTATATNSATHDTSEFSSCFKSP